VFTTLSTDLVHSWGNRWWEKAPLDFVYYSIGTGQLNIHEKKNIVVLLNILPDDINVGYHGIGNNVIEAINGQTFKSFKEFVLLVDDIKSKEKYTIVEMEGKSRIILSNKNIDEINKEILTRNNIPYQYSPNVSQWLNKTD